MGTSAALNRIPLTHVQAPPLRTPAVPLQILLWHAKPSPPSDHARARPCQHFTPSLLRQRRACQAQNHLSPHTPITDLHCLLAIRGISRPPRGHTGAQVPVLPRTATTYLVRVTRVVRSLPTGRWWWREKQDGCEWECGVECEARVRECRARVGNGEYRSWVCGGGDASIRARSGTFYPCSAVTSGCSRRRSLSSSLTTKECAVHELEVVVVHINEHPDSQRQKWRMLMSSRWCRKWWEVGEWIAM